MTEPLQEAAPRASRVPRSRAPAVAMLALALIGGAIAVDRSAPAPPSAGGVPVAADAGSGVAACPFAVEDGARSYLHLANLGADRSTARVSLVPARRNKAQVRTFRLEPGAARTLRLHGRVSGTAGVVVDHAGGDLVASHSLWWRRTSDRFGVHGGAAASCGRAGVAPQAVAHLRTFGAESDLAVFNPGSADADVSITLIAGRQVLRPQRLHRQSVPARTRRTFSLGDYAFDARELTAIIEPTNGRVVAEGIVRTRGGVSLVGSQPASSTAVAIAGASGPGARLGIASVGEADTGLDAGLLSAAGQGRAPGLPAELRPATAAGAAIPRRGAGGPAAYRIGVTVGSPLASGTSWRAAAAGGSDLAATEAGSPAHRWGIAFGSRERRTVVNAVVVNLGTAPADVRVRRIGGDGAEDITIEPGRLVLLPVVRGPGDVAVEVSADQPLACALVATAVRVGPSRRGGARLRTVYGFGMTAVALDVPAPVRVVPDPRLGVPAEIGAR